MNYEKLEKGIYFFEMRDMSIFYYVYDITESLIFYNEYQISSVLLLVTYDCETSLSKFKRNFISKSKKCDKNKMIRAIFSVKF